MTAVQTADKPKKDKIKFSDARILISLPILMVLLFFLAAFTTHLIPSDSMLPGLQPGDHILTAKAWFAYPFGASPKRGDVVVFQLTKSQMNGLDADMKSGSNVLIKRVIGLPGDTIFIQGDTVYVNQKPLTENYPRIKDDPRLIDEYVHAVGHPYRVAEDEYFLLGDNRKTSSDSRYWGSIKRENIIGRYVRVIYHGADPRLTERSEGK